ncbi:hypothetical protein EV650_3038 [Kribbella kalugense]|uniref:Uncharacterized protein n=1 Tax=Kribbella kalugense TaxID=2512221 RepID=A0A4R8A188_9ACTN|nr:hypothetical protein EV650_3038 [Kribbella kalugense]
MLAVGTNLGRSGSDLNPEYEVRSPGFRHNDGPVGDGPGLSNSDNGCRFGL